MMSQNHRPKISVFIATSLDGFIAGENGELDWLDSMTIAGEDYGYAQFIANIEVLVMGRNTYEKVLGFGDWPYAGLRVIVLSNSLTQVINGAELFADSPEQLMAKLRTENINHVYLDGGNTISQFVNANMVDEMIISLIPIILGSGKRLFNNIEQRHQLHLLKQQTFPSGLVQLHYSYKPLLK
jgi:dihydrofolate reductase